MSKQKRFSKLAIAAGLLLTASATCFAQTESTESRYESAPVAVAMNATPRIDLRAPKYNIVADTKSNANHTTFSASKFLEATKESVTNTSLNVTPTMNYEVRIEAKMADEQFSEPVKSKNITFVPSRGPKVPW